MSAKKDFRPDINGLRAWAVLVVVFFHFKVPGFSGGFVGVDVFFVISGYLMTSIIARFIDQKSAQSEDIAFIGRFYLSRAKRILPALIFLCGSVLLICYLLLPSAELQTLGMHTTAALAFVSNFVFWSEAGYFDAAAHEKWLLHTWSLSVEWQFYLLYPALLIGLSKILKRTNRLALACLFLLLCSLVASVYISAQDQAAAFYLLPTRAWEMLSGGIAFFIGDFISRRPFISRFAYFSGLAMIAASVYLFGPGSPWPSYNALLPVMGTFLVILGGHQRGLLTSPAPFQVIGHWSYSIYLWHWPIAVATIYFAGDFSPAIAAWGITTSTLLGFLSYRLIENKSSGALSILNKRRAFTAISLAAVVVAVPSSLIYAGVGIKGRSSSEAEAVFAEEWNRNPRGRECEIVSGKNVPQCQYGGDTLGAIVIGDSHAAAMVRAVEAALPSPSLHVLDWTLRSCETVSGLKMEGDESFQCGEFVESAIEMSAEIENDAPIIVINRLSVLFHGRNEAPELDPKLFLTHPYSARSPEYIQEMQSAFVNIICRLAESRKVYILEPVPELVKHVPKTMGRALLSGKDDRVSVPITAHIDRSKEALQAIQQASIKCGAVVLDPLPALCSDGHCWGDKDGMPLYFDDDHLSLRGADLLIPLFRTAFD